MKQECKYGKRVCPNCSIESMVTHSNNGTISGYCLLCGTTLKKKNGTVKIKSGCGTVTYVSNNKTYILCTRNDKEKVEILNFVRNNRLHVTNVVVTQKIKDKWETKCLDTETL